MMSARRVVAIGQFPPPVSGFSYITACVVKRLSEQCDVVRYNIAARGSTSGIAKHLSRVVAALRACFGLIRDAGLPNRMCYVACEGDLGLVYTLMVLATARILGYPIVLHHHSFSYIDRNRPLMRAVLFIGGDILHVFLCHIMRERFEQTYRRVVRSTILSNAAFVPPLEGCDDPRPDSSLVLGHLSNLTREKGLYVFLDLLRQAIKAGLNVRGVLAGPVALAEDKAAIDAAVADLGGRLNYLGPVYATDKERFYHDIDVFVFPTFYANEAQPTVIFEAQAAGCRVLANNRGCIANQATCEDFVVERNGNFVVAALDWLARLPTMANRCDDKSRIKASYTRRRASTSTFNLFSEP